MTAKELIDEIYVAAYEVRKILKPGFLESVYQNALIVELELRGIRAQKEVYIPVFYKNRVVGEFRADILVEGKVIIETKAVSAIIPAHELQVVNYLAATGIDDGVVINFGEKYGFHWKKRIYKKR